MLFKISAQPILVVSLESVKICISIFNTPEYMLPFALTENLEHLRLDFADRQVHCDHDGPTYRTAASVDLSPISWP